MSFPDISRQEGSAALCWEGERLEHEQNTASGWEGCQVRAAPAAADAAEAAGGWCHSALLLCRLLNYSGTNGISMRSVSPPLVGVREMMGATFGAL